MVSSLQDGQTFFCGNLRSLVILSDGRVTTCTADNYGHNAFANIYGDDFDTVVNRFQRLRIKISKNPAAIPRCQRCKNTNAFWKKRGLPKAELYSTHITNGIAEKYLCGFDQNAVVINLELASRCNLKCIGCAMAKGRAFHQTRYQPRINIDRFTKWIEGSGKQIKLVRLYHIGETWLHPRWFDLCKRLKRANPRMTLMTSTNGMLLTNAGIRDQIIESGIDQIMFSIHGARQESVIRYMGDRFRLDTVLGVIKDLYRLRIVKERQIHLLWKYLLFDWNDSDHEIQQAKDLASEIGVDEIHFSIPAHEAASKRFSGGSDAWVNMRNIGSTSSQSIAEYQSVSPTEAVYLLPGTRAKNVRNRRQPDIHRLRGKRRNEPMADDKQQNRQAKMDKGFTPEQYASRGHELMDRGNLMEALENLEHAISRDPCQPHWVFRDLGNVLVTLKKPTRAVEVYHTALMQHEKPSDFLLIGLARAYKNLGKFEDAAIYYQKGLQARTDENGGAQVEQIRMELYDVFRRSNKTVEASAAYSKWLETAYLINHKLKLIYCPIPKNACTYFKSVLVKNSDVYDPFIKSEMDIHVFMRQRENGFMLDDVGYLSDSDYLKFAIIRNPFDRLVSAYANLFIEPLRWNHPLEPVVKNVIEDIYIESGHRVDYTKSITFKDFILYVARTEDADLDYHWRPQHVFMQSEGVTFDLLGQFEKLTTVIQRLEAHTGRSIEDKKFNTTNYCQPIQSGTDSDKHPIHFLSMSKFPAPSALYTRELAALVRERFAEDFHIYHAEFGVDIKDDGRLAEKQKNHAIKEVIPKYRHLENQTLALHGGQPIRHKPFGPTWIIGEEEKRQVEEVMNQAKTNWRSGYKVSEFTQAFAQTYGIPHAIATSTGTAALHAAVYAVQISPGDEIITTAATDIGTVIGILLQNAVPVFADWDRRSLNTDPADIERKITKKTRAIIVVHLFGNPCDMGPIMKIARTHNLPVIEDCAQALVAEYQGQKVGTFGDLACFSFGQKTMTTHQGGMVITNNTALADRVRSFAGKGCLGGSKPRRDRRFNFLGSFYPMTDLQAAVGLAQLQRLENATKVREQTAAMLNETFSQLDGFRPPQVRPGDRHTYYVYPFLINPQIAGVTLQDFLTALRKEGIPGLDGPYLDGRPLHRYPLFSADKTYGTSGYPFLSEQGERRVDYRKVRLENTEKLLPHVGLIHMRNSFSVQDGQDIAAAILKVASHYARKDRNGNAPSATLPFPVGTEVSNKNKIQSKVVPNTTCLQPSVQTRRLPDKLSKYYTAPPQKSHWRGKLSGLMHHIRQMKQNLFRGIHCALVPNKNFLQDLGSANQLLNRRQYSEAAEKYLSAISYHHNYAGTFFGLGKAYHYQHRITAAIDAYREAINLSPMEGDYYHWLGGALLQKGETNGALLCYDKAIRINPRAAHYHRGLGCVLIKMNLIEEAISALKHSTVLDRTYFLAHKQLGDAFVSQNNPARAMASYQKALALQPHRFNIQKTIADIMAALQDP